VPLRSSGNGTSAGARVTTASPATATYAARDGERSSTTTQASVVPVSATSRLTPVMPIQGSASAQGVSAVA
jgi:hypothetical protein